MNKFHRLLLVIVIALIIGGLGYFKSNTKSQAQVNDKSKFVTKKVKIDNKKSVEQVQQILDQNGVEIDARELFSRGWKEKLVAKKNQLQSIHLDRKANKLKGLETADTLELSERTYIEDNTVLIVNNLKLKGKNPIIKGPHGLHIFVLDKIETDSKDTKITISADGLGRQDWLKMKKKDMSDGFDYSKFYSSYKTRIRSEKKEALANSLKKQNNPYLSFLKVGYNPKKLTIEEYIEKNPSLFESILQTNTDGGLGRNGDPVAPAADGLHNTTVVNGTNGTCQGNPNGTHAPEGGHGGDGGDGDDGNDGEVGGNANPINFTISNPNDTNSYVLSARGGAGGDGSNGAKGGNGGNGAPGGKGGDGASCSCQPIPVVGNGGNAGKGGRGGSGGISGAGGDGMKGGDGNVITITYPPGYNTNYISTLINGGQGGKGGTHFGNGTPGTGGSGGSPGLGGSLTLCSTFGNHGDGGDSGDNGSTFPVTKDPGESAGNGDMGAVLWNENSGSCPGGGGGPFLPPSSFAGYNGLSNFGPNASLSRVSFLNTETKSFCQANCGEEYEQACSNNNGAWDPDSCNCTQTPIIVDVAGNGYNLTNADNGVLFDISNKGSYDQIAWTSANSDDAFLVLDRNNNGTIDTGAELFGNITPQSDPPADEIRNGFLALADYDKTENGGNGDDVINKSDAIFNSLRLWKDTNHNGISETSELATLVSMDIKEIDLKYKVSKKTDIHGNKFRYRSKLRNIKSSNIGKWAWDVFLRTKTTF
jgi:hypothetical protein